MRVDPRNANLSYRCQPWEIGVCRLGWRPSGRLAFVWGRRWSFRQAQGTDHRLKDRITRSRTGGVGVCILDSTPDVRYASPLTEKVAHILERRSVRSAQIVGTCTLSSRTLADPIW